MLPNRLTVVLAALLAAVCVPALAQNVILDAPGLIPKKPPPRAPDVKVQAGAWPRLEAGTVLCKAEADLDRVAANRGGGPGGGPVDCRILREPTAVTIKQRKGGRSLVHFTDQPQITGWTDIWLPEKPPAGR